MKTQLLLAALSLTTLLAGCAPLSVGCTEIGCSDQLTLTFVNENNAPITDLAGEISFDGQTLAFDCASPDDSAPYECRGDQLILYAAPSEITIAAVGATHEAAGTMAIDYETLQPNGPSCPPTCLQATMTIATNAISSDP